MKRRISQNYSGFTLTELMISLVLSSLLMVGAYKVILGQSESSTRTMQKSVIMRQLHQSRQLLTDKIRFAGYNAHNEAVLAATADRLKIWADTESSGSDGYIDAKEAIEFRFVDGTLYQISVRKNLASMPSEVPLEDRDTEFPLESQSYNQVSWRTLVNGLNSPKFIYTYLSFDSVTGDPILDAITNEQIEKKDSTPNLFELETIREVRVEYDIHKGGLTQKQIKAKIEAGELSGRPQAGTAAIEGFSIRLLNRS